MPNLNLTAEERRVFGQLFREADTENIGVITGEIAVKFFEKTRLEGRILGEVSINPDPYTSCLETGTLDIMKLTRLGTDLADCRQGEHRVSHTR